MSEKFRPNPNEDEKKVTSFVRTGKDYWSSDEIPETIETHWSDDGQGVVVQPKFEEDQITELSQDLTRVSLEEIDPSEIFSRILDKVPKFDKLRELLGPTPRLSRKDRADLAREDRLHGRENQRGQVWDGGKICELGFITIFHDPALLKEILSDFSPMKKLQLKKTERITDEVGKADCLLRLFDDESGREVVIALDISFNQDKIPDKAARCARFSRNEGVKSDYLSFNKDRGKCRQQEHIPLVLAPLSVEEGNLIIDYAQALEYSMLLEEEIAKLKGVEGRSNEIALLKVEFDIKSKELTDVYRKRLIEANVVMNFVEDVIFHLELIIKVATDRELRETTKLAIKQLKIIKTKLRLNRTYTAEKYREIHQQYRDTIQKEHQLNQGPNLSTMS